MENETNKAYLAAACVVVFIACMVLIMSAFAARASTCSHETDEARITELLTPDDKFFVIDGDKLDLFIRNADDLYNIGWVRKEVTKIYAIDSEIKADNPRFQAVHLFFINADHCIAYYQTTYRVVVDLLLSPKPCKVLGITCGE